MEPKEMPGKDYLEDLQAIRYMLRKYEEKPIIEPWAFFSWSAIVAIGTLINWIMHSMQPMTPFDSFLWIWIPVLLVGGLLESVAFLSRIRKDETPLNTKAFVKTLVFMCGFFVVSTLMVFSLLHTQGPLPCILLLWLSGAFLLVGFLSYTSLFYTAVGLLLAAIPFLVAGWTSDYAYLATGILISLSFAVGGAQYVYAGKKRHE